MWIDSQTWQNVWITIILVFSQFVLCNVARVYLIRVKLIIYTCTYNSMEFSHSCSLDKEETICNQCPFQLASWCPIVCHATGNNIDMVIWIITPIFCSIEIENHRVYLFYYITDGYCFSWHMSPGIKSNYSIYPVYCIIESTTTTSVE